MGISLVSRCRCCKTHVMEDSDHLFFRSEWAIEVWTLLGRLLDRPRIHSKATFLRIWCFGDKKNYLDCFASGMASVAVWEIWKARNKMFFENKSSDLQRVIRGWAPRIASNIKCPYRASMQADLSLAAWGILPPNAAGIRYTWARWRPPEHGLMLNVALMVIHGRSFGVFLFRDHLGRLRGCGRSAVPLQSFEAIRSILDLAASQFAEEFHQVTSCYSSHPCFVYLSTTEEDIPHDLVYRRRDILQNRFSFRRVDPVLNGAALALVGSMPNGFFTTRDHISKALQHALFTDSEQLPCVVGNPMRRLVASTDDLSLRQRSIYPFTFIRAHDDNDISPGS